MRATFRIFALITLLLFAFASEASLTLRPPKPLLTLRARTTERPLPQALEELQVRSAVGIEFTGSVWLR
jgi:hypothetical protein